MHTSRGALALLAGLVAMVLGGCNVGGNCSYEYYPGTCTSTVEGMFSFEGDVQGSPVTLMDNALDDAALLPVGESAACQLELIRTGTCTPCMFDIGSCGRDAFDIPLP